MCLGHFGLYCNACLGILFVTILCMCCSHFSWYCFISFTVFSAPVFSLIHCFFSLSSFVFPRRCLKNFICAASKRCSSLFFSYIYSPIITFKLTYALSCLESYIIPKWSVGQVTTLSTSDLAQCCKWWYIHVYRNERARGKSVLAHLKGAIPHLSARNELWNLSVELGSDTNSLRSVLDKVAVGQIYVRPQCFVLICVIRRRYCKRNWGRSYKRHGRISATLFCTLGLKFAGRKTDATLWPSLLNLTPEAYKRCKDAGI